MKIKIKRYCKNRKPKNFTDVEYELPKRVEFLLEALSFIKKEIDPTLSFSSGCRSGICGSCAVRVNGKETLACAHKLQEGDSVEALFKMEIIKDLVVDHNKALKTIDRSKSYFLTPSSIKTQSVEDEKRIEKQSDCILCSSCFSSCPVLEVDSNFLGPFALTRAYRYVSDSRNPDTKEIIDSVQEKGVWDCTLCGECTLVCPQGIDPKNDILMLRSKSVQAGYSDPNFAGGGFDDDLFAGGFDPNF
jgi:fumarate reductase iron-sulfur subunit